MSILILRIIKIVAGVLVGLFAIGWLGFLIQPKNFDIDEKVFIKETENIDLEIPDKLQRYADKVFMDNIAEIQTSVIWGKAKINVKGVWMPARFVTYYIPKEGFFRYIEVTWFGIPIINGYDLYYDNAAEFCIAGKKETGEKIEQGQNLALWAETMWSPTAYFTDNRLTWENKDSDLLELEIPYKESNDIIEISIDPDTGLLNTMEAMRYKGQNPDKVLWHIELLEWDEFNDVIIPSKSSVKWADEDKPWSYWNIEGTLYNIEISDGFSSEIKKYLDRD